MKKILFLIILLNSLLFSGNNILDKEDNLGIRSFNESNEYLEKLINVKRYFNYLTEYQKEYYKKSISNEFENIRKTNFENSYYYNGRKVDKISNENSFLHIKYIVDIERAYKFLKDNFLLDDHIDIHIFTNQFLTYSKILMDTYNKKDLENNCFNNVTRHMLGIYIEKSYYTTDGSFIDFQYIDEDTCMNYYNFL